MKYPILFLSLGLLGFVLKAPASAADPSEHVPAVGQQPVGSPDADNTKRNVRDRDSDTVTPMDQGNSDSDLRITREIRQAVVANDHLSVNAKNVKIVTVDGVVTLRGPVKSPDERTMITSVAKKTQGVKRVDDQLEIERD